MNMCELRQKTDALVRLLEEWADWQKGFRMKLGYPTRAAMLATTACSDFEELCESVDHETYRIIDTVIQEDLPPIERAAILRRYEVAAVFRFPRENYPDALAEAHARLFVLLPKKGVIVL